eukprot:NODE_14241_length_1120_cov_2.926485.p1 GENE.NODE_14241_length_1120_cov_2.926485~~NODE_14241_length_1120_cov_2.926485.p1  ORF type:complete len:139 (+),score=21.83 NODE_14241_length_1120_cov_2.926485:116-532(+)
MRVYYWLPGDNDEAEHPNTFTMPVAGGTTAKLRDVRAHFPLPGLYHFRFKMRWESAFVWMDVTNEDSNVPLWEDKIITKVLRVNGTPAPLSFPAAAPGGAGVPAGAGVANASGRVPAAAAAAAAVGPAPTQDQFDIFG